MSYARFWWEGSQVYVYDDVDGGITCDTCALAATDTEWPSFNCATRSEMAAHLVLHRAAGHNVPQYAIDNLLANNP
jgi:hypothetical protein